MIGSAVSVGFNVVATAVIAAIDQHIAPASEARIFAEGPVNIGNPDYVTVDELVKTVATASGKYIQFDTWTVRWGVISRNFSNARIKSAGMRSGHCCVESKRPMLGLLLRYGCE